mmetsp:Transcript_1026/g.1512  ORF Transcript_1026/g.1512 Transcript_1026/m.1512 type:complete len:374 (-) Transcript_1026:145-1266(-)
MVLIQRRRDCAHSPETNSANIGNSYVEEESFENNTDEKSFRVRNPSHFVIRVPYFSCKRTIIILVLLLIAFTSMRSLLFTAREGDDASVIFSMQQRECSEQPHLEWRMSKSFDEDGRATRYRSELYGVIDNMISTQEAERLASLVQPYYDEQYKSKNPGPMEYFSPLQGLHRLFKELPEEDYTFLIEIRHRINRVVRERLGLCRLYLQLSAFRAKRIYDKTLTTHADSCTLYLNATDKKLAACFPNTTNPHYGVRMVGSVLFLNPVPKDAGGEFFLADQETGEPATVVRAKPGRLVYFTSGPECAHGALPVKDESVTRLSMANWYHMNEKLEVEREFFGEDEVLCLDTFGGCGKLAKQLSRLKERAGEIADNV